MTKLNVGDKFQETLKSGNVEVWEIVAIDKSISLLKIIESEDYDKGDTTYDGNERIIEGIEDGSVTRIK